MKALPILLVPFFVPTGTPNDAVDAMGVQNTAIFDDDDVKGGASGGGASGGGASGGGASGGWPTEHSMKIAEVELREGARAQTVSSPSGERDGGIVDHVAGDVVVLEDGPPQLPQARMAS